MKARRPFSPGLHTAALTLGTALSGAFGFGGGDYDVPPRRYRVPQRKVKTAKQAKRDRKRAMVKASRKANRKG